MLDGVPVRRRWQKPTFVEARVQTAAHLVDHVILHACAAVGSVAADPAAAVVLQPELVALVLQVVQRVITRHLLGMPGFGLTRATAASAGIPAFLPGRPTSTFTCTAWCWTAYCGADGSPAFVEAECAHRR